MASLLARAKGGAFMRRATLLAFAILLLMLGAMAAKSLLVSAPSVRAQSLPGQFDASRAKARLAFILGDQRPHPADSVSDDMVRSRLIATLQQMGLKPIVRDQVACNDFQKSLLVACARVRNVVAVLGPPTGKALLLSAHYDSVPVGPGASDDGIGVATLLEVGSNLKDRPLQRPVILLFNEGEELGLVGARAFLADPLSRNVDSLLNFEARGVTGPVTMFETSQPNGAAIAAFAKAAPAPVASSMSTDIARLIPNDTDATVYKERGWLTLNFAIVGNETRYHSAGDNIGALDPASLQHMGDQALAVASELSTGVPQARGDCIFFDVFGRAFIQMPLAFGVGLFLLLLLLSAAVAWKRGALVREPAIALAAILFAGGLSWLSLTLMGTLRSGIYWHAHPEVTFVAIYATVLFAAATVLGTLGARFPAEKLRAGFWLLFLLFGGALALAAPGAIIYFLFPPAIVLAGMAAARWYRPAETIGAIAALVVLYVTWGEMLALLEQIFSPGPLWSVVPVASLMLIPSLIEAQGIFRQVSRTILLGFAAVIALAAWATAAATPAYSNDRQQRFTIEHVTEFPLGRSSWSVLNDGRRLPPAEERLAQWRGGKLPFSERMRAIAPAPLLPGNQAPSIEPLEIVSQGTDRTLRLRLKANGAERVTLIAPAGANVRAAGVSGFLRSIGSADPSEKVTVSCTGRSCDGMELRIDQANAKPNAFIVIGSRNGLPQSAAPLIRARPGDARPQYTPDQTIAFTRVKL
jgi:hypothetical protein